VAGEWIEALAVYWLKTPSRVVGPGQEPSTSTKIAGSVRAGRSRFWPVGANVGKVGVLTKGSLVRIRSARRKNRLTPAKGLEGGGLVFCGPHARTARGYGPVYAIAMGLSDLLTAQLRRTFRGTLGWAVRPTCTRTARYTGCECLAIRGLSETVRDVPRARVVTCVH
jgi:hypothetical protein